MQNEKQQLLIILIIVFTGFIGSSIAYPIFPPLFLYANDNSIIPITWNESARSIFLGLALAAYPFGQFIGSSILGGCSDHYSRKRVLMLSLLGCATGYLLSAIALQFNLLGLLLTSRFLTGFMEGNFSIVRAMAADLESINKHKSFGLINGVSAIGYVTGPLLGGFLSDKHLVSWFSFAFPFFLAAFLSAATVILAEVKLVEKKHAISIAVISMWQRFNLVWRFRLLFASSVTLKYLLITSTIFTVAVDIFYEFGPVYLTGLWSMTPAKIAIYNTVLSFGLAVGSGWLTYRLLLYFSVERTIIWAVLITSIIFACMSLFLSPLFAFLLFGLVGLSIATANTNLTIQISNAAHSTIQGEAMGAQLSLRTLGDTFICLVGGFLIISSVIAPIVISAVVAFLAASMYVLKLRGSALKGR